ncbi:hypothetical protein Hanom_Chr07g00672991 [Helianthus anomalus]
MSLNLDFDFRVIRIVCICQYLYSLFDSIIVLHLSLTMSLFCVNSLGLMSFVSGFLNGIQNVSVYVFVFVYVSPSHVGLQHYHKYYVLRSKLFELF